MKVFEKISSLHCDDGKLGVILEVQKRDGSVRRDIFRTNYGIDNSLECTFSNLLSCMEVKSFKIRIIHFD